MSGSAGVEIKIDTKKIKALEADMERALVISAKVLQQRIRDAQVIPRDTGALQGEKFHVDTSEGGVIHLINDGPYAHRLYYHPEYNFRRDKNEFAQGLWFSLWEEGGIYQHEPQQFYEDALKRILKGKI